MKLCVFHGTFNPIHNGHIAMANYVCNNYDYNTVLFIPAYKASHDEFDDEMSNNRFQMVKMAVSGDGNFGISNIEFQNEKFSYTFFAIEALYKRYKIEGKIGFIIGFDEFREVMDWYEADKLKKLVHFIVFPRGGEVDKDRLALLHYRGYEYNIAPMKPIDISSTMIREKLAEGKTIGGLVPTNVLEYINENGLYKD